MPNISSCKRLPYTRRTSRPTLHTRVLGAQVGGQPPGTRIQLVQRRVGDVDGTVRAGRAACMHVCQHVHRASDVAVTNTHTAAGRHAAVQGSLQEQRPTGRTRRVEELVHTVVLGVYNQSHHLGIYNHSQQQSLMSTTNHTTLVYTTTHNSSP